MAPSKWTLKYILAGLLMVASATAIQLPVDFLFDDESEGGIENWNTTNGEWAVVDGRLRGTTTSGNAYAMLDLEGKDFIIDASVQVKSLDAGAPMIIFRSDSLDLSGNYCYLTWNKTGWELAMWWEGVKWVLASLQTDAWENTRYIIRLVIIGDRLEVEFRDSPWSWQFTVNDFIESGAAGFGVYGRNQTADLYQFRMIALDTDGELSS